MKNSILLLFLVFSTLMYSQNYELNWKKVIQYELDGKINSANNAVLEIYKKAKKKNNDAQLIKCFFYISKFKQVFDENAQTAILEDIKSRIKWSSKANKAILNTIYANLLENYKNINNYKIRALTDLQKEKTTDYLTWTTKDFEEEIDLAYKNSIKESDALRKISIKKYEAILTISSYTDSEKTSLYSYISDLYTNYYRNKIQNYSFKNNISLLFQEATNFQTFNVNDIEDKNLKRIITLFQENEKYYLQTKENQLELAELQRYDFVAAIYGKSQLYYSAIEKLEQKTSDVFFIQKLKAIRVLNYFEQSTKNETSYYDKALSLADSILKTNINPVAMAEVNNIKFKILGKSLGINVKKIIYPNEEIRALVRYKNVDSITIKYYKIPSNFNLSTYYNPIKNEDSVVLNYISKNKIYKSFSKKLPVKKEHFEYSTEILLEN